MKQRIFTAIVGGTVLITLLYWGGIWFALLIFLLTVLAYHELTAMARIPASSLPWWFGLLFLLILTLSFLQSARLVTFPEVIASLEVQLLLSIILFLLMVVLTNNRFSVDQFGVMLLAIFYVGLGFSYLIYYREIEGFTAFLFVLAMIWSTDSAAYFIGRRWGRHKLWAGISPNKTIEGSLSGIGVALLAALIFQALTGIFHSYRQAVGLAFFISIAAQVGDLIESALKRYYQVKDSGTVLPGHGGILDRFDSLIFVSLLFYLFHLASV